MQKTICFVDESGAGDSTAASPPTHRHHVFTAVLVREGDLEEARAMVDRLRTKQSGSGNLSSTSVGDQTDVRRKLVASLSNLPMQVVILAVDLATADADRTQPWPSVFFQAVNKLLFTRLISSFQPIEILHAPDGDADFRHAFESYVEQNLAGDLFSSVHTQYSFGLAQGADAGLLEVCSFLGDTYQRILRVQDPPGFEEVVLDILHPRILYIDHWPPRFHHRRLEPLPEYAPDATLDQNIAAYCQRRASEFLAAASQETAPDERTQECRAFLRLLLQSQDAGRSAEPVPTAQILSFLTSATGRPISAQHLRTEIADALRDQGILLFSSSKGYKLPTCWKDLHDFVRAGNDLVPALVARLKFANDAIRIVSFGQRDMLDSPEFETLRRLVDASQV